MCAELAQVEGEKKSVHVTVSFLPHLYSRLVLLAHRHDRSLGDEIRAAAEEHVERHAEEHKPQ